VWFAADDADADLRVRIRTLWLQRLCRFFLVVVGVSLLVLDLMFLKECQVITDENVLVHFARVVSGFCFIGLILVFFALVFYAFCNFVAWCLKQLAKYIWNE
jgi:hypothetical protein